MRRGELKIMLTYVLVKNCLNRFVFCSSCANRPEPCGWEAFRRNASNPQLLHGALVSGPDENDYYMDKREEYIYNEVTLDYNAGFQSAVAGLRHLQLLEQEKIQKQKDAEARRQSNQITVIGKPY